MAQQKLYVIKRLHLKSKYILKRNYKIVFSQNILVLKWPHFFLFHINNADVLQCRKF